MDEVDNVVTNTDSFIKESNSEQDMNVLLLIGQYFGAQLASIDFHFQSIERRSRWIIL